MSVIRVFSLSENISDYFVVLIKDGQLNPEVYLIR